MNIPILTVYDSQGNEIPIPAIKGADGQDGKSAYASAQDGGYTGTEQQFNSDLADVGGKIDKSVQAAKTAAMTQAVGIDSDGKLWSIPGGGGDDKLFECTYGVTSYSDVVAAINSGKIPYVVFSNHFFIYGKKQDGEVSFTVAVGVYAYKMQVKASGWSYVGSVYATTDDLTAYRTASAQDVIDAGKLDTSGGTMSDGIRFNYQGAYLLFNGSPVFYLNASNVEVGLRQRNMLLAGNGERPQYKESTNTPVDIALLSDIDGKADKPTIKTAMDSVAVAGAQYFLGTQSTVSITIPSTAGIGQEILVCFTSGSTAATLTCNLTGFSFVPKANKTSWIKFTCYDATNGDWLVETKEG